MVKKVCIALHIKRLHLHINIFLCMHIGKKVTLKGFYSDFADQS